jgi:hypothetical protein
MEVVVMYGVQRDCWYYAMYGGLSSPCSAVVVDGCCSKLR